MKLKSALDDALENLQPQDIIGGADPAGAINALKNARANYSAMKLSEALTGLDAKAERFVAIVGYGEGLHVQLTHLIRAPGLHRPCERSIRERRIR